jgi:hypothetical protein
MVGLKGENRRRFKAVTVLGIYRALLIAVVCPGSRVLSFSKQQEKDIF